MNFFLVEPEPVLWSWVGILPQAAELRNMGTGGGRCQGTGSITKNLPSIPLQDAGGGEPESGSPIPWI